MIDFLRNEIERCQKQLLLKEEYFKDNEWHLSNFNKDELVWCMKIQKAELAAFKRCLEYAKR